MSAPDPTLDPAARWLLVSDIDDTLTGDPAALIALGQALAQARGRVSVVLNSSRPAVSVADTRATVFPPGFPLDGVITALGTEIVLGDVPVADWPARFDPWPRDAIFATLAGLGHRPHAAIFQTRHKVSFAVPPAAQEAVRAALAARDLPCRIIASGASDFDIIPPAAGKDAATLHVAQRLGIAHDRLVVAGDSGNDLAMFKVAGHAIAVGNARSELLSQMPPGISYHATARHAAGVHEGLVRLGALPRPTPQS